MILVTHGTIKDWNPYRISHALLQPEDLLITHFQKSQKKYVSLQDALAGRGDALTVDDGTFAALHCVMLARHYGHQVSWFINGKHIEENLSYFPFQLSCMVDSTSRDKCFFDGKIWMLNNLSSRRLLRYRFKQVYMGLTCQEDITQLIKTATEALSVTPDYMDWALKTVSRAELEIAVDAGVDLQNHSWDHLNPQTLSEQGVADGIRQNDEYLTSLRVTKIRCFAPPFGQQIEVQSTCVDRILLADRSLCPGPYSAIAVNRHELTIKEAMLVTESLPPFAVTTSSADTRDPLLT